MSMELTVKLPISHACNRDCSRCHNHDAPGEPVLFAKQIREQIEFPEEPIDCKLTRVDLSCMFGGMEFSGTNRTKTRPTLVKKEKKFK